MDLAASLEQIASSTFEDQSLKQAIVSNANVLNAIAETAKNGSSVDRATAACKISEAIFGDQVVSPERATYTQERDVNWYVLFLVETMAL